MRLARFSRWTLFVLLAATWAATPSTAAARDAEPAADAERGVKAKKLTVAVIPLKEDYPEGPAPAGLFGELKPHLRDMIERLDKAAKDDKVAAVMLRIRSPELGRGKVDEIRAAIARVRKTGKKVYADVDAADTRAYLIASACDEIVLPPSGELLLTGLQAQVMFYKGLLDKLGLQAQFIQIGDYKGAAEPMTRTDMSPEFRKQFEAVIDDYYEQLVETIAADRKLEKAAVRELIDEGLFTPERAKEAKLIDRVAYEDDLADQLKTDLKAEQLVFDRQYGKKKLDTDFSGFAGFMKLMEIMTGAEPSTPTSRNPKIAVVYAVGPIMSGESAASAFGGESTVGSDTLIKALRDAEKDEKVKAIVLRVDSPGGSALASDLIWRQISLSKKPFVVSMGDVAASGGYYISMGAAKIFAEPGTLTGSIGVVGGKIALKGLLDKIGVTTEVISRGKNAGTLSALDPFTESEREAWKRMMKDVYTQFTTKAAAGRKMDLDKLEKLAGGRIFTGRMAVENGLVDKLGTLSDAIAEAKGLASLKPDDKIELQILPKPKSFFEQLIEGPSADAEARLLAPELVAIFRQTAVLRQIFQRPVATMLPYRIEIK
jgi:protease IV